MKIYKGKPHPELRLKLENWRSKAILIAILAGFVALAGRAFYLQSFNTTFLQAKGDAAFMRVVEMPASRGAVNDRNGRALAISTPVESIWASPSEAELDVSQIAKLAQVLAMDKKDLAARFAETDKNFVWLKRQINPEQAAKAMAMRLPGVFQQREYRRFYPAGDVTAHVIGFTDKNDRGQEGIELAQQNQLSGVAGQRKVIKDRKGRIVEDIEAVRAPRDGAGLSLSIDERLQYIAHRELKAAVDANKAKGGALVMLDARTGEVLALVNQPDFNPNNRATWSTKNARNRSVTDIFEPGSTFKPFAVAAGLEAGHFTPDTVMTTASLTIGSKTFIDVHPKPSMTVAEVIQKSSNVGTAKIAATIPDEQLWSLYSELGFGAAPRTGFPGEAKGLLRPAATWKPIEKATMSFGYGVSVSLLQLARSYTLFTNDGALLPVTFLKRGGDTIGRQIISPKTARALSAMLETVTQSGGTAEQGQVSGYRMAGKTGTAYKFKNGAYDEKAYLSSFVGYGPASNPQYIIAVTIDEPSAGKHYGGAVSAPVFANVMAQALRLQGVPPDGLKTAMAASTSVEQKPVRVESRADGRSGGG